MKKTLDRSVKLKLHRETLRALAAGELTDVAGGVSTRVCSAATCFTDCNQATCRTTC